MARSPLERHLEEDAWSQASYTERLGALQAFENRQAEEQAREPATVGDVARPPNELGQFRAGVGPEGSDLIEINQDLIKADKPHGAVNTIAHEGRHAYQEDCIERPESHPEVEPQTVEAWRDNFNDYKQPTEDDFQSYWEQPIEVDARAHADKVTEEMYGKDPSVTQGAPPSEEPEPSASQSGQMSASERAAANRPAGWARGPDDEPSRAQEADREMTASERAAANRPSPPPPPEPEQSESETQGRGR